MSGTNLPSLRGTQVHHFGNGNAPTPCRPLGLLAQHRVLIAASFNQCAIQAIIVSAINRSRGLVNRSRGLECAIRNNVTVFSEHVTRRMKASPYKLGVILWVRGKWISAHSEDDCANGAFQIEPRAMSQRKADLSVLSLSMILAVVAERASSLIAQECDSSDRLKSRFRDKSDFPGLHDSRVDVAWTLDDRELLIPNDHKVPVNVLEVGFQDQVDRVGNVDVPLIVKVHELSSSLHVG